MKRLIILFLFIFPLLAAAQDEPVVVPSDSVAMVWNLDRDASKAWDRIDSVWMDSVYWNTLKKHKIKMSCAHCTGVMMHVDMQIDSSGHLASYRLEAGFFCDEKLALTLENEFMQFFLNLEFPPALRGRVFRTFLGTALKC
jgi:hypothetical protein